MKKGNNPGCGIDFALLKTGAPFVLSVCSRNPEKDNSRVTKMLSRFLLIILLGAACSLVAFGQGGDSKKDPPPKKDPPVVVPVEPKKNPTPAPTPKPPKKSE